MATLSIALQNQTTSATVYAYITGTAIDHNNAVFLLSADGKTPFYPTSPAATVRVLRMRKGAPRGSILETPVTGSRFQGATAGRRLLAALGKHSGAVRFGASGLVRSAALLLVGAALLGCVHFGFHLGDGRRDVFLLLGFVRSRVQPAGVPHFIVAEAWSVRVVTLQLASPIGGIALRGVAGVELFVSSVGSYSMLLLR